MPRKKSKAKPARQTRTRTDWAKVRAISTPVLAVAIVLALGIGLTFGVRSLDHTARVILASNDLRIELEGPRDAEGLAWVPPHEVERMREIVLARMLDQDPFDPRPLARASEDLLSSGWFDGQPTLERIGRDTIRVTGTWRMPAAVVRSGGRDHLISWDGMPLPLEFAPGAAQVRIIFGAGLAPASNDPRTRFAHPWPGTDVHAALALLRILAQEECFVEVGGIDVAGLARQGHIEIVTTSETRVVWGAPPDQFRPGEVPTETKLQRLSMLRKRFNRIDGGGAKVEIHGPMVLRNGLDIEP